MSDGAILTSKMIPIIVITWIISLVTTLAVVYVAPNIFPISVTADNIADSAVITTKLADGNVTSAKVLDGTLTAVDIADGSIITVKVSDGAVTTAKIADGAVTTDKIDDEAVTTAKIANSAIVTIKLADGSVTSAKILDGTVAAVDLADNSIITAKIANGAVTTEKIADGAVTTSKIADGNITATKLASDAIPYNLTSDGWWIIGSPVTTSTTYEDMLGMTMNITLTRNSTLLIMLSTEAYVSDATASLWVLANVSGTIAHPGDLGNNVGTLLVNGETNWACYTFTFYLENVVAGTHEVKIRWHTTTGDTAYAGDRTLVVTALPE